MVSVVLIILVLLLAGSALMVLYGRISTRSAEASFMNSVEKSFLKIQSAVSQLEAGDSLKTKLKMSADKPFLSAWGGRAGSLFVTSSKFTYKRTITITNLADRDLSEYPVRIWLTADNFDFSKTRSDGGDIRFYQNERSLDYWIEKWDATNENAVIWVEVLSLPASENENIEVYYGYSEAQGTSDPKAVWLIYEDMDSAPEGELKGAAEYKEAWKCVRLTKNITNENGELEYQPSLGDGFLAKFELWAGLMTGFDNVYVSDAIEGAEATWLYAYDTSTPASEDTAAGGYHFVFDEFDDEIQLYWDGSKVEQVSRTDIDNFDWHSVEIRHWENRIQIYYDGSRVMDYTDSTRTKTGPLFGWGARTSENTNEHRIRNLYVRKYVYPEPSASIGEEQLVGGHYFGPRSFGVIGIETRGWFYPWRTFVYEGGAVIENESGTCYMVSEPVLVSVQDAGGENVGITVNYVFVDGSYSLVSSGEREITLTCTSSGYRVTPREGPNRENVVIDLTHMVRAEHRGVWRDYLARVKDELNAQGLNASLDGLKLTILGRVTGAGTKDIYYREKITEIRVESIV